MKKVIWLGALALGMGMAHAQTATVTMARPVPYADESDVADAVRKECKLDEKVPDFIAEAARQKNITVKFASQVSEHDKGRVLVLEITNVINAGNAFLGHAKSTAVNGKLYDDGKLVGDFHARRNSMGGAFAGFKGNCSVLGRTVETLGQDIAEWLQAPHMKTHLGD